MALLDKPRSVCALLVEVVRAPRVTIDLMCEGAAANDPFFDRITREFYQEAREPHRRFLVVPQFAYGYAVGLLPPGGVKGYLATVEASARRNVKKAIRSGYRFSRFDYNAHLPDVTEILRSAEVRQGRPMPEEVFLDEAEPHTNPPSRCPLHDYPYFGVFRGEQLVAYASCLVAGELCDIQSIYGHADFQPDGVVPLLIASIAGSMAEDHPAVKYYSYGTYFGATKTMQRFKRKFSFQPHRVTWKLGA
ncbi:MAG: hypothetical protein JWN86_555 [Planctomycetota bacterium]|nr:hypothetical protein [Planctomycetota bacterium]